MHYALIRERSVDSILKTTVRSEVHVTDMTLAT